jgi:hypothetical protein
MQRANGLFVLALSLAALLFLVTPSAADHDRRHERDATSALLASAEHAVYDAECGSCHLAYPPGMLPERSWRTLMGSLDAHFGENAELEPAVATQLTGWLSANAAEARTHRKSAKILRSIRGATPTRLSQLPYLLDKHEEVEPAVFRRASVKSRANCGACHRGAKRWDFNDDDVKIPPP